MTSAPSNGPRRNRLQKPRRKPRSPEGENMNPIPKIHENVTIENNRVIIYVPHKVAFDFEKLTKISKEVLGRLGCDNCHSGRILDYRIIERFAVNSKLEINEVVADQPQF
jgi:hypothetical protein